MATPPTFTSGSILTAAQMNAVGLWKVSTTTFTGSSLVAIDNVFTTDYDNYRIYINAYGSAASYGTVRFRASGTAAVSGYYFAGWYSRGTTLTYYNSAAVTEFPAVFWGASSSAPSGGYFEVYNPKATTYTGFQTTLYDYGGTPTAYNAFGHREPAASYDGFQVIPQTGNFTGTITVYGYRK